MKSMNAGVVAGCAGLVCGLAYAAGTGVRPTLGTEDLSLSLTSGIVSTAGPSANLAAIAGTTPVAGRYVIQLDGPMTPARWSGLEAAGVAIGDYLPTNAYIVDLSAANPQAFGALPFVRWAAAYQQAWKLDPELGTRTFQNEDRLALIQAGRQRLDVTLFDGAGALDGLGELNAIPGTIVLNHEVIGGNSTFTLECDAASVASIAALSSVQFIEESPDVAFRNGSTTWIVQSNVLNSTPIHARGIRGLNQIVGVMDGKVWVSHCSFVDTDPIGPLHRKIQAYNSTLGADSHGTHVACTVVGDNGVPGDLRGIAYEGRLVYNVIPSFTDAAMYGALLTHHNQGARVHTNSWGDDGTTQYNALCRGIDRFMYDFEDSLVLFAVTNQASLKNPENAKNLLACGATSDTPNQANWCTAGTGPTADGRRKPEIFAPGCNTTSASSSASCGTANLSGTSMATPALAGCAMLVRQYFMDGFYPTGAALPANARTPTAALIKAVMLNSAVDMTGVTGFPSNQEGWGRVLLDNALFFPGDARELYVEDVRNAQGMTTGGVTNYVVNVDSTGQPLKVTLVWTEPAATAGAANPVINNLNLTVIAPGGATTYLGNVFTAGVSSTGGVADAKNNVEMVLVNAPAVGQWTIRISAAAVQAGAPQGWSIAATGDLSLGNPCKPDLTTFAVPGQPGYGVANGLVNNEDFFYYLAQFNAANLAVADLTATATPGQPGYGVPDGILNNEDFFYYLAIFSAGCP